MPLPFAYAAGVHIKSTGSALKIYQFKLLTQSPNSFQTRDWSVMGSSFWNHFEHVYMTQPNLHSTLACRHVAYSGSSPVPSPQTCKHRRWELRRYKTLFLWICQRVSLNA